MITPRKPASFITLEGGEGTGKSTQARLLADRLAMAGIDCVMTREPGGSPFAEEIRNVLLSGRLPPRSAISEALLFLAARADHVAHTIAPALAAGRWVICDRFSDSTRVYQGIGGRVPKATLVELDRLVLAGLRPDLTLMFDLAPEVGLARAGARRAAGSGADPYESRDLAYHRELREGFRAIAEDEPDRCALIDADGTPDQVAARVWAAVAHRLPTGLA
ncbi:MAG: dTMP kinase [Hyphomicrobiaceae bacterium]